MTLRKRIGALEQAHISEGGGVELDLPQDLQDRINAAFEAGLGMESLSDTDLMAIVAASDKAEGRA